MRLKGVPVTASIQATPGRAKKMAKRMAKGWVKDSKRDAMTR